MITSFQSALTGMDRSLARLDAAAERIGRTAPLDGDLPGDLVDLKVSQRGFEANLAVAKTADEMVASLLDLFA